MPKKWNPTAKVGVKQAMLLNTGVEHDLQQHILRHFDS
jgi:hypothetical protein